MAKGQTVITGVVLAGMIGAAFFVTAVPNAMMNVLGQGTGAQDTSDFDELVGQMEAVCADERESATGSVSLFDGSIMIEDSGDKTKISFYRKHEGQTEEKVDCPLDDSSIPQDKDGLELTGTTSYTIQEGNQDGNILVQKDQITSGGD